MESQRAGIYCRLSYAPDGSLEKVERQEADCRQVAAHRGWRVAQVYSDNSRSAWQRNRKRPEWDRMLDDLKAGHIDSIIVYHGDRLIRQPWDLEVLLQLADDKHVPLASVSGVRDLNNEDDRFALRIEAAQACRSSADTSRRVSRGWQARAERGQSIGGGKRPFGYGVPTGELGKTGKPLYDVTQQVPEEAAVLREAVDRLRGGQSLGGVIAWMNTVSTTSQGQPWHSRTLKAVLRNPRYIGVVSHGGKLHPAAWDPIITPEEQEDVKAILDRNHERHGYHGRARKYLLAGIAECATCESRLQVKPGNRGDRHYYCKNSDCSQRVYRSVANLDAYVSGRVLRRLNERRFIDAVHGEHSDPGVGADIAALERRKAEAKATLEQLADHPDVDPGLIVKSLASFDRKINDLRGRQHATTRARLLARMAGMTREQWDAEPIDVCAETVRALFRVEVLPTRKARGSNGFDPASVRVTRR